MSSNWLLVGLHGYGGTGADFARLLEGAMPGSVPAPVTFAPDGASVAALAPKGFAWHDLTRRPEAMVRYARGALPALSERLRVRQERLRIPPERTAAVGFSQGGMLATALLASGRCAAAASICAPLPGEVAPPGADDVPRLLCVVGGRDRTMPSESLDRTHGAFTSGYGRVLDLPTLDHEASMDAVRASLEFVWSALTSPSMEWTWSN